MAFTILGFCSLTSSTAAQTGATLQGRVKLGDSPLSGVIVAVSSAGSQQKRSAQSDINGNYEIRGLSGGIFLVSVGNTPYVLTDSLGGIFRSVEIGRSGATTLDLLLTTGGVVSGCVEYASGQPVIGREVLADEIGGVMPGFSPMNFRRSLATDDRGCFRLFGLPTGRYRVGIGKSPELQGINSPLPFSVTYYPGVQTKSEALTVNVEAKGEYDLGKLILKSDLSMFGVRGVFIDQGTGQRVADFGFELVRRNENAVESTTQLTTNSHGEFTIPDLFQGRYSIRPAVRADVSVAHTFTAVSFTVLNQDIEDLSIGCTSLVANLSGQVLINDSLAARSLDCTLALKEGEGLDGNSGKIHRIVLQDGHFSLSGLTPGTYTLVVMPLRSSLQYEHALVGLRNVSNPGAYGVLRLDLSAAEQTIKIFLSEP
jgi:hypothetical protein